MKKSLIPAIALMALSQIASAQVTPQFDLTGNWLPGAGGVSSFFQKGDKLDIVYVNADFAHYFNGRYTTPTQAEGTMIRVTRAAPQCTTKLKVTFNPTSVDFILVSATGLDSKCDLLKGQVYTDTNSRIFP